MLDGIPLVPTLSDHIPVLAVVVAGEDVWLWGFFGMAGLQAKRSDDVTVNKVKKAYSM